MSAVDRDEETTADRLDQRQKTVLMLLFSDPSPWTVQELGRELHGEQLAEDAVRELAGAGLVHRLVGDFVVPTRAARRADDLYEVAS
jgi:hypothetical protein